MAILAGTALAFLVLQETPPPTPPAPTGLELGLRAYAAEVALVDRLRLHVTLTNHGPSDQQVPPLVLDRRSLTVALTFTGANAPQPVNVERVAPDSQVAGRAPLPRVTLPPGESVSTILELPMLWAGPLRVTAQIGSAELTSPAAEVLVTGTGTVTAEIETSEGTLRFPLDLRTPRNSALHFTMLAQQGFYDGLSFHTVVPGKWVQGGCPYGLGAGGPGFAIPREQDVGAKFERGVVALASFVQQEYAGSQFFIVLADLPGMEPGAYTILGKIGDPASLQTLDTLGRVEVDAESRPEETLEIRTIRVIATEAQP